MFIRPASELPHPHHETDDVDLDAEARFRRIVAQLDEIGRRNDAMRRRLADRRLIERLIAGGDRPDT